MNVVWILAVRNLIPMETTPEMMPTLTSRVKEREPSDKNWNVRRPRRPKISARITTATNVNNMTAQEAQVVEVRDALVLRSNSK